MTQMTHGTMSRLAHSALTDTAITRRFEFAKYMLALRHTANRYYKHLVWCDLCNSILPRTQQKGEREREMVLARKGGKGTVVFVVIVVFFFLIILVLFVFLVFFVVLVCLVLCRRHKQRREHKLRGASKVRRNPILSDSDEIEFSPYF